MMRIVEGFEITKTIYKNPKSKKRGRPLGSKNKPGHKAGGKRKSNDFMNKVVKGTLKFFDSPFK